MRLELRAPGRSHRSGPPARPALLGRPGPLRRLGPMGRPGLPGLLGRPGPVRRPAPPTSLWARLSHVYARRVGPAERALLLSWAAFGVTFGVARSVTHLLRRRDAGSGGSGGIVIAGRHIHHYNFGIALLIAVGAIAVHGQRPLRRHPLVAAAYGTGTALIVDEFALLLDLQDVYWAREGRSSVDVALGAIALGGLYLAAVPFWHGAAREVARTRLLPDAEPGL
ncbi:MAG: hypothetical protein WCA46_29860 [Actinocatenispora sp.]